jgi:multicomponent Na+:H+ antiporter subunit D
MMFLVAFGIKAALFPLFFWLPAAYHTPPTAVSAIFAGLLTKVGVYAIVRVFTLLFSSDVIFVRTVILFFSGFTMVVGVLGAASQNEIRRILSFHIVSQIGYMIMGLGLASSLALTGTIFYIIHHIIVKTNLFLIGGLVDRLGGTAELKSLGGLYRAYPLLALLFLIPALSLAGIPPLSGFWSKLMLIQAGLAAEQFLIVVVSLVVSLLTLFSMTKIWAEAFWKEAPAARPPRRLTVAGWWLRLVPVIALATLTVIISLWAEPVYTLAAEAAGQLLNRGEYIQTVLPGGS